MNHLREKLLSGETAIGTHISLSDSTVTEIMGRAGFDYLWIDTEQSQQSTQEILRDRIIPFSEKNALTSAHSTSSVPQRAPACCEYIRFCLSD